MTRYCQACAASHEDRMFPSDVSEQCATSMMNHRRTVVEADVSLPFVQMVADVERVSGLPIGRWVGEHRRWHWLLSRLLYEYALSTKTAGETKRLHHWVQEENRLAAKN